MVCISPQKGTTGMSKVNVKIRRSIADRMMARLEAFLKGKRVMCTKVNGDKTRKGKKFTTKRGGPKPFIRVKAEELSDL